MDPHARAPRPSVSSPAADGAVVAHFNCAPLVLSLLAEPGANVGMVLDAAPGLIRALEPLTKIHAAG